MKYKDNYGGIIYFWNRFVCFTKIVQSEALELLHFYFKERFPLIVHVHIKKNQVGLKLNFPTFEFW